MGCCHRLPDSGFERYMAQWVFAVLLEIVRLYERSLGHGAGIEVLGEQNGFLAFAPVFRIDFRFWYLPFIAGTRAGDKCRQRDPCEIKVFMSKHVSFGYCGGIPLLLHRPAEKHLNKNAKISLMERNTQGNHKRMYSFVISSHFIPLELIACSGIHPILLAPETKPCDDAGIDAA